MKNEIGTINVQWDENNAPGSHNIFLREFTISGEDGKPLSIDKQIIIRIVIDKQNSQIGLNCFVIFYNYFEQAVFYLGPLHTTKNVSALDNSIEFGCYEMSCAIPP